MEAARLPSALPLSTLGAWPASPLFVPHSPICLGHGDLGQLVKLSQVGQRSSRGPGGGQAAAGAPMTMTNGARQPGFESGLCPSLAGWPRTNNFSWSFTFQFCKVGALRPSLVAVVRTRWARHSRSAQSHQPAVIIGWGLDWPHNSPPQAQGRGSCGSLGTPPVAEAGPRQVHSHCPCPSPLGISSRRDWLETKAGP